MRGSHLVKKLAPLGIVGLVALDLASAPQQVEDVAPDAYFDPPDATTAASIVTHVAIIRSDNGVLADPVPTNEKLTAAQIRDMVYAVLQTDRDYETERPRLVEMIAQVKQERDSCWVAVKSNLIGYPGRALYTQGDQTDIRVTSAVMSYLADSTEATRISMLACGGYKDDYREQAIFETSKFISSGLRWNEYFWDLPDEHALQDIIDELAARHPDKVIEGINLNYDELYENGLSHRAMVPSDRIGLKPLYVPVPVSNGIGALPTSNTREDGGYIPTAAILHSDLLVNIPVMKTTGKVGVNGAMKNYIGSVSRGVYGGNRGGSLGSLDHGTATEDHAHTLEKTIVNLFSYHPSDYVIFDALVGLEGDGSHPKGNGPTGFIRRNFLMAGEDPVAMESVAAMSMGLNPRDLDLLLYGQAKGWGEIESSRIAIEGNSLDDVRMDMMHPIFYTNYTAGYYYGRGNRRWLISGPYEGSDLEVDYLGNEAQASPAAGQTPGGGRIWKPHFAPKSFVDLWDMYQGDISNSTVYAFTRAHSDVEQTGELWVGATKGIQVYVNGERVVSERTTGGHAWKGTAHPVTLLAGNNDILVKVTHASGSKFGFSLALVDDGLGTNRVEYIPHTGRHTLGEPIAFTDETKRQYFGGDTLPGVYYHLDRRSVATAVEEAGAARPGRPVLQPNYPNPFNALTVLPFEVSTSGQTRLIIYNAIGERVRTLVDGTRVSGSHLVTWDGRDDEGRPTASGMYVARLASGSHVQTRKLMLLR